jgi:GH15 family glucan-1,4-alpha-glucosidase
MAAEVSKIQDYAVIGDGRSAALISNRGSIDWLCWPRFDSASILPRLSIKESAAIGAFAPRRVSKQRWHYIDKSNVLEMQFVTASGRVVLTDFMPATSEEKKHSLLWPEHELVRQIKCEQGEIELIVDFNPRLDYGRLTPKIQNMGNLGCRIDIRTKAFALRSNVELAAGDGEALTGKFSLTPGEAIAFSLSFSAEGPAVVPPLGDLVSEKLDLTITTEFVHRSPFSSPTPSSARSSAHFTPSNDTLSL